MKSSSSVVRLSCAFVLACALAGAALPPRAQAKKAREAKVEKSVYGKLDDGTVIDLYTLKNAKGATAKIITYGATLTELWVPDKNGKLGDVVLGFDDLKGYLGAQPFFGATIGRYGNRIAKGKFALDGKEVALPLSDFGRPNMLHGGVKGFDKHVWKAEPLNAPHGAAVRFTYFSKDGEEGFPGNLTASVTYTLTDDNAVKLEYTAKTDKPTVINLTNHSYFILAGEGDVLNNLLYLNADRYTPVDSVLIPTGELAPVKDTPFDFTTPTAIGARASKIDIGGYDHNYALNGTAGTLRVAGRVTDPTSGREMEIWTTEPGIQFYSAIGLDGTITGKRGAAYKKFGALCLETQHYPDSPNHANFPSTVLRPGHAYHTETVYKFTAK